MPLAFRPNRTVPISLDVDDDLPIDKRPAFLARFLSEGDAQELDEVFERYREAKDDAEGGKLLRDMLARSFSGWKNMPPEAGEWKGSESLWFLTWAEIYELLRKVRTATTANLPFGGRPSESS